MSKNNSNSNSNSVVEEARMTFIGRLFTLGGSVLFFIGSLIVAILGYQSYIQALDPKAK